MPDTWKRDFYFIGYQFFIEQVRDPVKNSLLQPIYWKKGCPFHTSFIPQTLWGKKKLPSKNQLPRAGIERVRVTWNQAYLPPKTERLSYWVKKEHNFKELKTPEAWLNWLQYVWNCLRMIPTSCSFNIRSFWVFLVTLESPVQAWSIWGKIYPIKLIIEQFLLFFPFWSHFL